jgi:ATP phosphoribosyltransferase regulatory subunit
MIMQKWLLPEYIEDILPQEALRMEMLRRRMLDLFFVHGYELVMPPMVEYLESLLTGTGHDLDLKTFKLVDQLSGRMMGVRADITPQVARIDAHLLNRGGVTRLCYSGNVIHTLPSGLMRTREPVQIGAELYGHSGVESDIEIQKLMLNALQVAGIQSLHLDLGHVGVFRALMRHGQVDSEQESSLFQILQNKDVPGLRDATQGLPAQIRQSVLLLPTLYGDAKVLEVARRQLPDIPEIVASIDQLDIAARSMKGLVSDLCVDLAELRGYYYHSGMVFAAYVQGHSAAIARGGRYDEVGKAFGRARPATGFTIDLRDVAVLSGVQNNSGRIAAPYVVDDLDLTKIIEDLRAKGEVVVVDLPGHADHIHELNCQRQLLKRDRQWIVEPMYQRKA